MNNAQQYYPEIFRNEECSDLRSILQFDHSRIVGGVFIYQPRRVTLANNL